MTLLKISEFAAHQSPREIIDLTKLKILKLYYSRKVYVLYISGWTILKNLLNG